MQEAERSRKKKKYVILVHGMGTPKKNSMLLTVVDAIARWMDHHKAKNVQSQQVQLEEHLVDTGPSTIDLSFADQHWKFVEVWWASSFDAPTFDPMIGWTVRRFIAHLTTLALSLVRNSILPLIVFIALGPIYIFVFALTLATLYFSLLIGLVVSTLLTPILFVFFSVKRSKEFRLLAQRNWPAYVGAAGLVASLYPALTYILPESDFLEGATIGAVVLGVFYLLSNTEQRSDELERSRLRSSATRDHFFHRIAGLESRQITYDFPLPSTAEEPGGLVDYDLSDLFEPDFLWDVSRGPGALFRPAQFVRITATAYRGWAVRVARSFYKCLRWAGRNMDEQLILERIWAPLRVDRKSITVRFWARSNLFVLYVLTLVFHGLNAAATVPLYVTGAFLITPAMFLVWLLSFLRGMPRIADFVIFLKRRLDSFIVGSLGDIKVFMEEPTQANRIRKEMERALEVVETDTWIDDSEVEVYIVAHSTGAAIAYEFIVLSNSAPQMNKINGLITLGSIMRMAWNMQNHRTTFGRDSFLPPEVSWINLWTRYDPALAGPTPSTRKERVWDICVSNEGDPFNDHSAYWANDHQVIPTLIKLIWGRGASIHFNFGRARELTRLTKRKCRILVLALFRLPAWIVFPFSFFFTLKFVNGIDNDHQGILLLWEHLWQWMKRFDDVPLVGSIFLDPQGLLEKGVTVLAVALLSTGLAQMVYRFLRALFWDGVLNELRWFRA